MAVDTKPSGYGELERRVGSIPFRPGRRPPEAVERHATLLKALAGMDGVSLSLYDLAEGRYVFLKTAFREALGLPDSAPAESGLAFYAGRIHPEDRSAYFATSAAVLEWFAGHPDLDPKDYRTYLDYRIADGSGEYRRLAQQNGVLETDLDGLPWLVLTLIEPSKLRDLDIPLRRSFKRKSDGEFLLFPQSERTIAGELSARETEILSLVSKGFSSADIARVLSLSVHTVNTHRRNILDKLNAGNASDAVRYAGERGFI